MTERLTTLKQHRCFGGTQGIYRHELERHRLRDGVRGLPAAAGGARAGAGALLALRPDLHLGQLHREGRRAALRRRARADRSSRRTPARAAPICRARTTPMTSARRRLLRRRHRRALGRALPHVQLRHRRAARAGQRELPDRRRPPGHLRPFDGRPRRADLRAQEPETVPLALGLRADLLADPLPLGREGALRLSRRRPRRLARPTTRALLAAALGVASRGPGRPGHRRRFPHRAAQARSCSRRPSPPPASR